MSESVSASAADAAASLESGSAAPALVQFADAPTLFADALPSDWAFAAQEGSQEGDAIDAIDNDEVRSLPPLIAVATFVVAEAELFDAAATPLVAFAPEAGDEASDEPAPENGLIMWSGEEIESSIEPVASHHGDTPLLMHDFVSHGISYDWTDPLFAYS